MIIDDLDFRNKLETLKRYFEERRANGTLTEGLDYIYKVRLMWIYKIVFEGEKVAGDISKSIVFRDIEDSFIDGADFLNSTEGKGFIEIVNYFAKSYSLKQ